MILEKNFSHFITKMATGWFLFNNGEEQRKQIMVLQQELNKTNKAVKELKVLNEENKTEIKKLKEKYEQHEDIINMIPLRFR